jgi:ATP-dependent RNA helicase DeaD
MTKKTFADLWLSQKLLEKIEKKGYTNPSPIQEGVIPLLLNSDKDIIWQAQTWTWKTAAFALPILERLEKDNKNVQALILTPTRELSIQVAEEIKSFTDNDVKVQLIYGGQSISKELDGLKRKPQIVVGTTWRVIDHILRKKSLKVDNLKYLVLDEADEMLNMGFVEDIEQILQYTPENKKTLLFSATMPKGIRNIVNKYIKDHNEVKIEKKELTNPNIEQKYFRVDDKNKFDALCRILEVEPDFYGIVFCRTKADVDDITSKLVQKWYKAEWLHWDISQNLRERTLWRFKNQVVRVLVATDVAARWIDVNNLTHVINYTLPENPEVYTHRIWRTGRAWNKWEAISLVGRKEWRSLAWIEKTIKTKIQEVELPKVEELIKAKRERLINKTAELLEKQENPKYLDLASDLLKLGEAEKVLSAVLEEAFGSEYLETHYKKLVSKQYNVWGETRLFIARWKLDNIKNPGQLIKFVENETGHKLWDVGRIDIKDKFSFMNVTEDDAYVILRHFKKDRRPIITQAKERR